MTSVMYVTPYKNLRVALKARSLSNNEFRVEMGNFRLRFSSCDKKTRFCMLQSFMKLVLESLNIPKAL